MRLEERGGRGKETDYTDGREIIMGQGEGEREGEKQTDTVSKQTKSSSVGLAGYQATGVCYSGGQRRFKGVQEERN